MLLQLHETALRSDWNQVSELKGTTSANGKDNIKRTTIFI